MKISLSYPSSKELAKWLSQRKPEAYSYPFVGATKDEAWPSGYNHDRNKAEIGSGSADFDKAKQALMHWTMFPRPWTRVFPSPMVFEEGKEVAVMFRLFGLWWWNSCRIVYVIDEPGKYGFAYGTLWNHVERGEEIFYVEQEADGRVWYKIEAFSQPRFVWARLFKFVARAFQRRFVRGSKAGMKAELVAR
ncbi:MAG: DUF1990 domain-containing protein [Bacteroidia bacterium]|jgi:uncharacterized protein (UPF0548 family)|nr:DUF1990 domain-containing protein [Bacteroidia bacterium]